MSSTSKKSKSRKSSEILEGNPRCIYCPEPGTTVEHMPPRMMFRAKDRPAGMEFASCAACNHGTSAADAAVAFLARIDRAGDDPSSWKVKETRKPLQSLRSLVPDFIDEFFDDAASKHIHFRTGGGVLVPAVSLRTGPIGQTLVTVFSAKLGMALFYEHVGRALPLDGAVFTMWFLNAGLSQEVAEGMLAMLPSYKTLKQGERKSASGQFDYRFNSDDNSIVAALSHFHSNVHIFTIATSEPEKYPIHDRRPFTGLVKPGELVSMMPKRRPVIFRNWNSDPQRHSGLIGFA